jgi:hypothetical protein
MGPRKCIYTNEQADSKDPVLPRTGDVVHNWTNYVPASSEYVKEKKGRIPTDLEMEANRIFHFLELAKLDVAYFTLKLKEVQEKITGKKQEEIEKAHHIEELTKDFDKTVKEALEKEIKIWE